MSTVQRKDEICFDDLTAGQQEAHRQIHEWVAGPDQIYRLGGLAGSGKTALVSLIMNELIRDGHHILVGTPTGKAASVLNYKFKCNNPGADDIAKTLHQIAYDFQGVKKDKTRRDPHGNIVKVPVFEEAEFACEILITDESSMIGAKVFDHISRHGCKILMVGDHGQLDPVGQEPVFTEGSLDFALTEPVRQAADDPISHFALHLRAGGDIKQPWPGINHGKHYGWAKLVAHCIATDVDMVVVSTNKARFSINQQYRSQLGFHPDRMFSEGEKLMVLKNHYAHRVFNGETWMVANEHRRDDLVTEVDLVDPVNFSNLKRKVLVWTNYPAIERLMDRAEEDFDQLTKREREIYDRIIRDYSKGQVVQADSGYAYTCWKAQGSEAKNVMVVPWRFSSMNDAQWARYCYTAATRAKRSLSVAI